MKSTNKNFLYNVIYQLLILAIPFITTPYISRVLGVDNIGVYSYSYSIINYFMLAAMLGITNYGTREIAKSSDDINKRSKTFFSIYALQFTTTTISTLILACFILFSNFEHKQILLIQSIFLISCFLDINWLFFGLEKFKITVSRNLVIKILSLIATFAFVKEEGDLWKYALIIALSTLLSQAFLWLFATKEVRLTKINFKDVKKCLKPCLTLFIPVIAYTIYRITDKTMIGYFSSMGQLGNYESAEKIINIPLGIIAALGTVMMPHMSKTEKKDSDKKIKDTYRLNFFIIAPICVGLAVISYDFCRIFFGDGYELTPLILIILLSTVIFSSITSITRNNYLIPRSKDDIYVKSTIYGAIINLILNLIFIPKFGALGACIGTVVAEFSIMLYQIVKTKDAIKYKDNIKASLAFVLKSILMGCVIFLLGLAIPDATVRIIAQIAVGVIAYALMNVSYMKYDFLGAKQLP